VNRFEEPSQSRASSASEGIEVGARSEAEEVLMILRECLQKLDELGYDPSTVYLSEAIEALRGEIERKRGPIG
jgi:hypothetical protein